MTAPDKTHGGLVESALEALSDWLRLAAASVKQAANAKGRPLVEAELHEASAERYEQAAQRAEKVAEACRIQRNYHRAMAETLRPKKGPNHVDSHRA